MDFLSNAAVVAAAVVLVIEQILKLNVVPVDIANKYPVLVNVVLSVVATYFLVPVHWSVDNIGNLLVQIGTVSVIAAIAYNQVVKNSAAKKLEG